MKRPKRDGGFTLVELLIAIVLSGIIAGVTVSAMATSMNVATSTSEEVADTTDAGLISAFLFRDAQAAGSSDPTTIVADALIGVATAASITDAVLGWAGCNQTGTFVARFSWVDVSSVTERHAVTATYALDADHQLTRRLCENGATKDLVLGHHLTRADAHCLPDKTCIDLGGTVALTLSGSGSRVPFRYTLTASLRVDAPHLAPVGSIPTQVALVALGDAGSSAPCPNLTIGRASVSVVGDAVVGADCGPDAIAGDQKQLQVTGALSIARGVVDPFEAVALPVTACDAGQNPSPIGNQVGKDRITTYPSRVSVSGPVQFEPGTYIFCDGLEIGAGAAVVGTDVFLVIESGTFTVSDHAIVHLAADRTGDHANLLVWVATTQKVVVAAGEASGTLNGYLYAPTSQLIFTGAGLMNIGGVVARGVTFDNGGPLRLGLPVTTAAIVPSNLPNGQVGAAYPATTMTASGGAAPYRWSALGLPDGVVLDAATALLSGSPKASGSFDIVVTSIDAMAISTSEAYTVIVNPQLQVAGPGSLPSGEVGVNFGPMLATVSGGTAPLVWSATGLAPGLSIDAASGAIGGIANAAGSFTIVVLVTDAIGAIASATYGHTISPALAIVTKSLPDGQPGMAYSATTMASSGGSPAYTWSATGLPDGLSMSPSGAISGTPKGSGSFAVVVQVRDGIGGATSAGYILVVSAPLAVGTSSLPSGQAGSAYPKAALTPAGGTGPYVWSAVGLPGGLSIDAASGVVSGVPKAAGTADLVVTAVDSTGVSWSANYSLLVTAPPTIIGPPTVPNGQVGSGYPATAIVASGGTAPYTWGSSALPSGLALDASTGVLSGTPNATGTYPVNVVVTDAFAASAEVAYTLSIASMLTINSATLPDSQLGVAYTATLAGSGGTVPYTWAATGLPAGLTLSADGVVFGTPKAAGTYSVSVIATDAAGWTASRTSLLSVSAFPAGCPSAPSGWRGEYFANISLTAPATLCRDDAAINFDWGTGATSAGLPTNNFSVRWTRSQDFAAGTYVFSMGSDDGGRLYIDGLLVLDHWVDHTYPSPVPTTTQTLAAGVHHIVMEYYDHEGDASATLSWGQ